MTVIRPNSISGITSITAQANEINVFRSNGLIAGLNLNGVNFNTTAGISTLAALKVTGNVDVAGVLTYQDVTNVDSLGIGTFRTGINVSGGQLDVGSNIKLGNAGVVTATSFVGSGANLTALNIVTDTSPQLGGDLDLNGNNLLLDDNEKIFIGTSNDGSLFNSGSYLFLKNHSGGVAIQGTSVVSLQKYDNADIGLQYVVDGKIQLNYDNVSMLETETRGAFVMKADGGDTTFTVGSTDANGVRICLDGDSNGDAYGNDYAFLQHDSSGDFIISADNPAGNSNLIFKSGNSSETARINSDGTVTLGAVDSSSSSALHIRSVTNTETTLELSTKDNYNGTYPSAKISFTQQNGTEIARIKCDTSTGAANMADLTFWTNYGGLYERLKITKTGEVGIGRDSSGNISPRALLEINAPYDDVSDNDGSADLSTNNHDALLINIAGPGAASGKNIGSIVWGGGRRRAAIMGEYQSSDSDYLALSFFTRGTDGPNDFYKSFIINHNGSAGLHGSLSQNTSDDRLKKDKVEIENALDKVNSLSSFTHKWNEIAVRAGLEENKTEIGLSAQEVQGLYPSLVNVNNTMIDPDNPTTEYLTIHYEKVVPLLVASIKELTSEMNTLKTRLSSLEGS